MQGTHYFDNQSPLANPQGLDQFQHNGMYMKNKGTQLPLSLTMNPYPFKVQIDDDPARANFVQGRMISNRCDNGKYNQIVRSRI
jgi:hypothetical protein